MAATSIHDRIILLIILLDGTEIAIQSWANWLRTLKWIGRDMDHFYGRVFDSGSIVPSPLISSGVIINIIAKLIQFRINSISSLRAVTWNQQLEDQQESLPKGLYNKYS